jgi:hypothetical protein
MAGNLGNPCQEQDLGVFVPNSGLWRGLALSLAKPRDQGFSTRTRVSLGLAGVYYAPASS